MAHPLEKLLACAVFGGGLAVRTKESSRQKSDARILSENGQHLWNMMIAFGSNKLSCLQMQEERGFLL